MKRTLRAIALLALAAPAATGCATSHVDEHWGESHRTLVAQQRENPCAGDDIPVMGLGATSADQSMSTYHYRQTEQAREDSRETLFDYVSDR